MSKDHRTELSVHREKAILVGVLLPDSKADPRDPLAELTSLATTAGAEVVERIIQQRHSIDPGTYIGRGKAEEIGRLVQAHAADVVIFDNDMSPNQLRNLEKLCACKILDRSELILDIFGTRARTREAQLQVALAQMEYTYPRLRHMWAHLERIGSGAGAGVGARGPGEMQLEIDRRLVRDKISDLKKRIADVQERKTREVSTRKEQHFTVSLVGYTNAGKSTLFNTLTGAGTLVEDKLFATLDTKTRQWRLAGGHSGLLSDTVGFVRDLPHHLVASFKATLEEATHADLLLLVLDISHPHATEQLSGVQKVLMDIGCGNQKAQLLLNKTDAVASPDDLAFWRIKFPAALPVSAKTGEGVARLTDLVLRTMLGDLIHAVISLSLTDSKGITFLEKYATVLTRDYQTVPQRVLLEVQISTRIMEQMYNHAHNPAIVRQKLINQSGPAGPTPMLVSQLLPAQFGADRVAAPGDCRTGPEKQSSPPTRPS
ncbi:MAG: GTPase HflX [Phycisphaerae bacterium]